MDVLQDKALVACGSGVRTGNGRVSEGCPGEPLRVDAVDDAGVLPCMAPHMQRA